MKINIIENGYTTQAEILKRKIAARIPAEFCSDGLTLKLSVDPTLGVEESYEIRKLADGYEFVGSDILGLSYAMGKFLHTARWSEVEFAPNPPSGIKTPHSSLRCVYFIIHFYNWYQTASEEELSEYLEEMLLWGYNTAHCLFAVVGFENVGDDNFKEFAVRIRRVYSLAKKLGMKTSLGFIPNQGTEASPHELDGDDSKFPWKLGRNLCPSKPGTIEHLSTIWGGILEQFTDIGVDFLLTWPYDEGGCSCEKCWPWGSVGYGNIANAFHNVAVKYYPNAKFILSTWCFEETYPDSGEYEGFYNRLRSDLSWVDYIMVDAHTTYPQYVLDHEPVKPIVNFPEISMWRLYPWGGFGANPLPKRFEALFNSSKHLVEGGMPYSEGIYEDILKVQWAGYYWDPDCTWRDILGEYISYEYSPDVVDEVLEVMELIEKNHVAADELAPIDLDAAHRAKEIALAVDAKLSVKKRSAWRWRILLIRTLLDVKRYEYFVNNCENTREDYWLLRRRSGKYLVDDSEAQELMNELCRHYHCVDYNGRNKWTHPPVNGGDVADTSVPKPDEP